jgi:penicillin-binding protein 1A
MRARARRWFASHPSLTRSGLLGLVFFGGFGFGGALAAWILVCRGNRCPSVQVLKSYQPSQTSKLYAVDGRFVAELGAERRTLVKFEDIPQHVRDAFVITEDKRFYWHGGIDWFRIPGSAWSNIRAGSFAEGFSTITMQLARNIFPDHISREKSISRWRESLIRKIKEGKVALAIEREYPKNKVLELYLNQINLGSASLGMETA